MPFGEIFKGKNSIGFTNSKFEIKKFPNSPLVEITQNENFEDRNDIGTECPKVEMTFGEMYKGRNNIGLKSTKVEMT